MLHTGTEIAERIGHLELSKGDSGAARDIVLAISQFDARFSPIEYGRRDGCVAGRGVAIGNFSNVLIDAENLLNHHDRA